MEETHTFFKFLFTCLSRHYKTTLNVSSLSVSPRRPCVCDTHFRLYHFSQRPHVFGHSGQLFSCPHGHPQSSQEVSLGEKTTCMYRKPFIRVLKGLLNLFWVSRLDQDKEEWLTLCWMFFKPQSLWLIRLLEFNNSYTWHNCPHGIWGEILLRARVKRYICILRYHSSGFSKVVKMLLVKLCEAVGLPKCSVQIVIPSVISTVYRQSFNGMTIMRLKDSLKICKHKLMINI